MIKICKGNIFNSKCQALVNPVNCVGVMGAGLALKFKQKFPNNFSSYYHACKNDKLKPGMIHAFQEKSDLCILNLATKAHYRENSKVKYILNGLDSLTIWLHLYDGIKSIAIPAIGCGLGGLNWLRVKRLIEMAFEDYPEIEVELYPPK